MSFVNTVKAVSTILSIAQQVILSVEETNMENSGAAKKALAIATIRTLYDLTSPTVKFDDLIKQVESVVDAVVAFYNTIGVFKKALQKAA